MASYASDNGTVPRYGHHITDTVNPVISYSSVIKPIYHTPAHNRFPNKRAPFAYRKRQYVHISLPQWYHTQTNPPLDRGESMTTDLSEHDTFASVIRCHDDGASENDIRTAFQFFAVAAGIANRDDMKTEGSPGPSGGI